MATAPRALEASLALDRLETDRVVQYPPQLIGPRFHRARFAANNNIRLLSSRRLHCCGHTFKYGQEDTRLPSPPCLLQMVLFVPTAAPDLPDPVEGLQVLLLLEQAVDHAQLGERDAISRCGVSQPR